jgi:transcriptional regulator with XRE-family HTH domain
VPGVMQEPAGQPARLAPRLSIGELSRLTQVSPSTLREWESHGIVTPQRLGKWRWYRPSDVDRVMAAREMRRRSFSPAAIAAALAPESPAVSSAGEGRVAIGQVLRQARLSLGASLREVARSAGISVSHLSTIERGVAQPSLGLLHRLAACYGIDAADLFGGLPSSASPQVRKWSESDALVSDEGRVRVRPVSRSLMICSDMYEADPGGGSGEAYQHDGEESAFVLEGQADFVFGDGDAVTVHAGESVTFSSRIPHRWVNSGPGTLRMLWTNVRQAGQAGVPAGLTQAGRDAGGQGGGAPQQATGDPARPQLRQPKLAGIQ